MRKTNICISTPFLGFLCAYGVFDPGGSFWPFVLSVALHEGGHLLALKSAGKPILGISGTLGGITIITTPLSYGREILVAAAGPMVNFLLMCLAVGRDPVLAVVNGGLLCYNLLPFYPIDGGRILHCTLGLLCPVSVGEVIERGVGLCTFAALFLGAVYLCVRLHSGIWPMVFCIFLFFRVGGVISPVRKNNSA